MNAREKTTLLTKVGFLWLRYLGCTMIAPEVRVLHSGLRDESNPQDRHTYIDLVGIYSKYIPREKRVKEIVKYISSSGQRREYEHFVDRETITRGLEIKVSRADFKNGFIHVGCDYHYLMIPKGLVTRDEVTKGIGIIEVDLEEFRLNWRKHPGFSDSYWFNGVERVRRPTRKKTIPTGNEYIMNQMAYCNTSYIKRLLQESMKIKSIPLNRSALPTIVRKDGM